MNHNWENDKNNFQKSKTDLMLLAQLPDSCKIALYTDFIFKDFLWKFRRIFRFKNDPSDQVAFVKQSKRKIVFPFYTFEDQIYSQFMLNLMNLLEVRSYEKGDFIANEMDESLELLFVESGIYEVGYEINNKLFFQK